MDPEQLMDAVERIKALSGQPMCLFTTGRPDGLDDENAAKMILLNLVNRAHVPLLSYARGGYRGFVTV